MSSATNATIADIIAHTDFTTVGALDSTAADTMWLMVAGFLVFFMQLGFALLEAGTIRSKNTKNILLKNMLDACIGCLIWWSFGHAIAYDSGDGFIGMTEVSGTSKWFFMQDAVATKPTTAASAAADGYNMAAWFFQFTFAAAAATIVSGAMAERTALTGYIVYTTVITGFVYPVVVHWVWSGDGWLSAFSGDHWSVPKNAGDTWGEHKMPLGGGVTDFAGSGAVHMTGGVAAFCGAAIVGPRTGRFGGDNNPLVGHSTTMQVMGTLILWVGWYGFNPGSTLGIAPAGFSYAAARSVVTTTISAAAGCVTVVLLDHKVGSKSWSVGAACNGILAGLVSITAGCSVVYPGFAFLAGLIGGFVYFGASTAVAKCKVDDPLDAVAVHGACGMWGVLAAALFMSKEFDYRVAVDGATDKGGVFTAGNFSPLGAAAAEIAAVVVWTASITSIMFLVLKKLGLLRVSAEVEAAGMDVSKHGGSAYPESHTIVRSDLAA